MVKNVLINLLFCIIGLYTIPVRAINDSSTAGDPIGQIESCSTPAPDSFRVTGYGYQYVSLAWNPAFLGAEHHLSVFISDTITSWDSLYYVNLSTDTDFTLLNFDAKKQYRVALRTVCPDGNPSTEFVAVWPDHGVIIELSVGGRTPADPKVVDCHGIAFMNPENKWVGFRLSKLDGETVIDSNLFEFVHYGGVNEKISINRQLLNNALVSANLSNEFPNSVNKIIPAEFEIKVGELDNFGFFNEIGRIELDISLSPFLIMDICPNSSFPITTPFRFEPLVASKVIDPNCLGCPPNGNYAINNIRSDYLSVQNPVTEYINVFFHEKTSPGRCQFQLINLKGEIILDEILNIPEFQASLSLPQIQSGIYLLKIKTSEFYQCKKIIKS